MAYAQSPIATVRNTHRSESANGDDPLQGCVSRADPDRQEQEFHVHFRTESVLHLPPDERVYPQS